MKKSEFFEMVDLSELICSSLDAQVSAGLSTIMLTGDLIRRLRQLQKKFDVVRDQVFTQLWSVMSPEGFISYVDPAPCVMTKNPEQAVMEVRMIKLPPKDTETQCRILAVEADRIARLRIQFQPDFMGMKQ